MSGGDGGSWASSEATARSMRSNTRRDTAPELAIRRLLHARGYRYRVDFAPWPNKRRRADIVFTRLKVAVFVDGCFWHACPEHSRVPLTNREYWEAKLKRNARRDLDTTSMCQAEGWTVVRIWEHVPADEAVAMIVEALGAASGADGPTGAGAESEGSAVEPEGADKQPDSAEAEPAGADPAGSGRRTAGGGRRAADRQPTGSALRLGITDRTQGPRITQHAAHTTA